ncbi:hypothetical protein U9M48_026538, partial [Paspalum notatum var. saurae]
ADCRDASSVGCDVAVAAHCGCTVAEQRYRPAGRLLDDDANEDEKGNAAGTGRKSSGGERQACCCLRGLVPGRALKTNEPSGGWCPPDGRPRLARLRTAGSRRIEAVRPAAACLRSSLRIVDDGTPQGSLLLLCRSIGVKRGAVFLHHHHLCALEEAGNPSAQHSLP